MFAHGCKLQVGIIIGHMVKHVRHGNHHRWAGGLVLILFLLFIVLIFLWLLETTEKEEEQGGKVERTTEIPQADSRGQQGSEDPDTLCT